MLNARDAANPRVLIAATLRWPLAARLAIAFRALNCPVQAWCQPGHPLEKTRAVERIHHSSTLAPQRSLRVAIRAAAPDLVIPCDDDAAIHLHGIHQRSDGGSEPLRRLIERSLGTPASCALATTRGELMRLAQGAGLRVPVTAQLRTPGDLDAWGACGGFPAVIKIDRSWGGLGVTVVRDLAQARAALHRATHPSALRALSRWLLRRDPSGLLRRLAGAQPGVTIQTYISGRPANRAVACWRGEVLAGINVVALRTLTPTGPASVVRVVENAEMADTARRLVRVLGLSGFCGLDFVVETSSGAAWLIEVNPRATPVCHLGRETGQDLPAALRARLLGKPTPASTKAIRAEPIALFPGELCRDPASPFLRASFHDVPWGESELVRDCLDAPWEERGLAARLRVQLSARAARGSFPFPARPGERVGGVARP